MFRCKCGTLTHHVAANVSDYAPERQLRVAAPLIVGVGSVTGLINRYSEPYDVDACIQAMMASSRWPRPGYMASSLRKQKQYQATSAMCIVGMVEQHTTLRDMERLGSLYPCSGSATVSDICHLRSTSTQRARSTFPAVYRYRHRAWPSSSMRNGIADISTQEVHDASASRASGKLRVSGCIPRVVFVSDQSLDIHELSGTDTSGLRFPWRLRYLRSMCELRQVEHLDNDVKSILLKAGENGEALVQAFIGSNKNEADACASAMRLLRDRSALRDSALHPLLPVGPMWRWRIAAIQWADRVSTGIAT